MSSYLHFEPLEAEASEAEELAGAVMPDRAANRNTPAGAGRGSRREHARPMRYVHSGVHGEAKHSIHGVMVRARQGARDGIAYVSTAATLAAR